MLGSTKGEKSMLKVTNFISGKDCFALIVDELVASSLVAVLIAAVMASRLIFYISILVLKSSVLYID